MSIQPAQHIHIHTSSPRAHTHTLCCPCVPAGLALYSLLLLIMDGPAALVIGLTGLRMSPHFDQPWRATSVASFWSKRWDLAAGALLFEGGGGGGMRSRMVVM